MIYFALNKLIGDQSCFFKLSIDVDF